MERPTGALGGSNKLLTSADVASLLGMSLSNFQKRWRQLGIPYVKRGHLLRFLLRDVEHWIYLNRHEAELWPGASTVGPVGGRGALRRRISPRRRWA